MNFICPICKGELCSAVASAVCGRGHSFDRAKEGYYNLLLSQTRKNHGDNREMIDARRRFLSLGYYQPLAERVAELVLAYTKPSAVLVDAGCGEGYYTDIIERALFERDGQSRVFAFDISKDAARRTARLNSRISVAVASAYSMPFESGSVDTAVNVFSPLAREEILRILAPSGRFILVYPEKEHLFGLKAAIYDTPYKNKPENTDLPGFSLLYSERLRYEMNIEGSDAVKSLFMMTPYAYRTGKEERERVLNLSSIRTDADFMIAVYEKE